jgi:hypothetical protein
MRTSLVFIVVTLDRASIVGNESRLQYGKKWFLDLLGKAPRRLVLVLLCVGFFATCKQQSDSSAVLQDAGSGHDCQSLKGLMELRQSIYKKDCLDPKTRNEQQCENVRQAWEGYESEYWAKCRDGITKDVFLESSSHKDINTICTTASCFKPSTEEYIPDSHDCDDFASEFYQQCAAKGVRTYVVHYGCGNGGHAINAIVENGTLCFIEPQVKAVIRDTCFAWSKAKPPKPSDIPPSVGANLCRLLDPSPDGSRDIDFAKVYDENKTDGSDYATNYCAESEADNWFPSIGGCNSCCLDVAQKRQTHVLPGIDPVNPASNTWLRQCYDACQKALK